MSFAKRERKENPPSPPHSPLLCAHRPHKTTQGQGKEEEEASKKERDETKQGFVRRGGRKQKPPSSPQQRGRPSERATAFCDLSFPSSSSSSSFPLSFLSLLPIARCRKRGRRIANVKEVTIRVSCAAKLLANSSLTRLLTALMSLLAVLMLRERGD